MPFPTCVVSPWLLILDLAKLFPMRYFAPIQFSVERFLFLCVTYFAFPFPSYDYFPIRYLRFALPIVTFYFVGSLSPVFVTATRVRYAFFFALTI